MSLGDCFKLFLCLAVASIVNSQSETSTTENPRNYLFVKQKDFAFQLATNKTRFTDEEKALILQIHNSFRSLVQPPATNMRELVWDGDLEEYAWNHTQACTGAHSAGTMVKKWRPSWPDTWETWTAMGENLYYRNGQSYSIEEALWMFWSEGKDYDVVTGSCTPGKECGHYRVMTLANSGLIGCAINVCNKFSVSKYPTPAVYLSCSYDGKYLIYYVPYKVGERGSDCRREINYDYQFYRNGLCVTPDQYIDKWGFDGNTSLVGLPSPYLTSTSTATPTTTTGTTMTTVTTTTTAVTTMTTSPTIQPNTTGSLQTTTTLYTDSSTPPTRRTTESTVEVTSPQEDTSIIVISSTTETEFSESTTIANITTKNTTSGGDITSSPTTLATRKTHSSTPYTSTKHTRSVNHSCRPAILPTSLSLLLFCVLATFGYTV